MGRNQIQCDCNIIHPELVEHAKSSLLCEDTLCSVLEVFKAMADSTRIKIINLLINNNLCVCDIAHILNMTKSAVSHQLKYLRKINLIKCQKNGKEVFYSLADNHVSQLFDICHTHVKEGENEG